MAFTKEQKKALVTQYENWLKDSQAVFVLSYSKMSMREITALRSEARDIGGEIHVIKNTLMNIALKNAGYEDQGIFDGSSIVGFAFEDPSSLAKVFNSSKVVREIFTFKGGYLNGDPIDVEQVITLANLPPMPQMRAQLLAMIAAPAAQFVRTLAEPARAVAAVLMSYSEKEAAPAAG
ncbi:MAG TPA: 50S ribosomal protein L10 [Anaerolineae bacterium]|nr:50S ribosomal protein L10 [Anaerolineae bacterium]